MHDLKILLSFLTILLSPVTLILILLAVPMVVGSFISEALAPIFVIGCFIPFAATMLLAIRFQEKNNII